MKFSQPVPCNTCGRINFIHTTGEESYPDSQCECGVLTHVIDNGLLYPRIYTRSEMEFHEQDWTLAIILAAMSVETYWAHTFMKWRSIDDDVLPHEQTPDRKEAWEEEFRQLWQVGAKFDGISTLLTGQSFDNYVTANPDLFKVLQKHFPQIGPSAGAKEFIIQQLFWKRNKILHSGMVMFGKQEAESCLKAARACLGVFSLMENHKYKARFG